MEMAVDAAAVDVVEMVVDTAAASGHRHVHL